MDTIPQDLWNKLAKIRNIEFLDQSIIRKIVGVVLDHHQVDKLEDVKLQAQADAKALSGELGWAGEWPLKMPPPSRLAQAIITKFQDLKDGMASLLAAKNEVSARLGKENLELQRKLVTQAQILHRANTSRDSAWKSFHAVNDELGPMRTMISNYETLKNKAERLQAERDNLHEENLRIHKGYQEDMQRRIATISEMQKQLNALTERILALKIEMH